MKTARKVIIYLLLIIAGVLVTASVSVWVFKDDILRKFIAEANKSLNTPVRIGKMDISLWSDFPDLSIVFEDVYVEDSHPGNYPLLTASRISFSLNIYDVWAGHYAVKGLRITDGEASLKIDENNVANYDIVKSSGNKQGTVVFDLKNVTLENTRVTWHDAQQHSNYDFNSEKLKASVSLNSTLYDIEADGDVTTKEINTGKKVFLKEKAFVVQTHLTYDAAVKKISITTSSVRLNRSFFEIQGTMSVGATGFIDLTGKGKETDIQTLLSLLPAENAQKLSAYRSEGQVYLTLNLKGEMSEKVSPSISMTFGCKDASVYHPEYKSKFEHATLEGSFASPSLTDFTRAALFLKGISGELNGKKINANFSLQNFDNPLVAMDFKGDLDAGSLLGFYPIPEIHALSGTILVDVTFEGQVSNLRKKSTAQLVKTQGSIEMKDIELTAGQKNIHFKDVGGALQFNNNDLALSDVNGKFENSDFRINGFLKNVITWFLFDNQPLGIEADLRSNFLDLDQLFSIGFSEQSGDFNFHIAQDLHLNFDCDVKYMKYRRFRGRDVRGDLLIKNQMAVSRNINLRTMGGSLSLNGILDAKNPRAIDLICSGKLTGIKIDSVFYVFENFNQSFIEDKHLKGDTYADVSVEMTLNEKLNLYPETLTADIGIQINNGELNQFEPMQKLNKYLDDEGLAHLRFANLKNDIHIEKKTIYIPPMEVQSNVTTIQVSGTHTFDQRIDYHIAAPLSSRKKIDRDEAFGAIEEDNTGRSKLFLKITGTTSKYTVSYDKEAVKKKIRGDLKKEVQELKDAFKNKGMKKKKELELEKDQYFDWDNNPAPPR